MLWVRQPSWDLNPGTCAPRAQGSTQAKWLLRGPAPGPTNSLPILAQPQRLRVQDIAATARRGASPTASLLS